MFQTLRRHFVLQVGKLIGNHRRNHIHGRYELAQFDHYAAHLNRQPAETLSETLKAARTAACHKGATQDPAQHDFPQHETDCHASEESQKTPVAAPIQARGWGSR
jgi:hypothetical protein